MMGDTSWKLAGIRRGTTERDEWSNATVIWLLDHIDTLTAERDAVRAHVIGLGGFLPNPRKPDNSPSPVEGGQ
jgi:hypothetical protein